MFGACGAATHLGDRLMDSMFLHLGALAFLAGFLVKDIVLSRGLFALGAAAGIAHAASAGANIGLIGWLLLFVMANFFVIWRVLKARLETPLSEVETALHTRLAQFTLPDFKRLMRIAEWQTLIDAKQITNQGAPTDHLYYIVSGSAQVDPVGREALVGLAEVIAEQSDLEIVVEGHTDTDQVRSTTTPKNNWELSVLRATAVVEILLENAGVDPAMLSASGRGEYHPVDASDKAKNRRIEVILAPNLDSLYELISE